ncbi:MAG: DUF3376 domain-containing protein [Methylocystis sp.]|nr:DUF3376 domain-containing protein [Methylocystis sp.]
MIRAWRERCYDVDPRQATPAPAAGGNALNDYLTRFDLSYRIRRLRFVLRKLDTLHGLQLASGHPAYEEAVDTRFFGLVLQARETAPPKLLASDLAVVRLPLARACAKLHRTLRRLLEPRDPPDMDTPNPSPPPDDDPQLIVLKALPDSALALLLPILCDIAGISQPEDSKDQPPPASERRVLTTRPLERPASESRLTDLACDRRAASRLDKDPQLHDYLGRVADKLANWLEHLFNEAHQAATKTFDGGDAGRIARRYYQCFDFFDCVQFPMMFGTDIGEPDIVDIIRVCPEDAPALVAETRERRTKLKGLAVAHFGAFLDRDWRISDLLWGRLDGAERIITALLPLQESAQLRNRLIDEAHEAILKEFEARPRLGTMALDPTRNQGARHPLTSETVQQAIDAIAQPATAADRQTQTAFMSLWRMLTPAEPNRVMLMRTLARGATIVGHMLDGIAGGTQLSLPAKWLANAGRALWALVEISVPRDWRTLLGKYWHSLLLLISIILILGGLLTAQPAVSGFGWAALGFAALLLILRTILWDFMRAGKIRAALGGLAILIAAVVASVGGVRIYGWIGAEWENAQAWTCGALHNCPSQFVGPAPRAREGYRQ